MHVAVYEFALAEAERLFSDGMLKAPGGKRKQQLLVKVLTIYIRTLLYSAKCQLVWRCGG